MYVFFAQYWPICVVIYFSGISKWIFPVLINAIMWPILNFFYLLSGQILLPNAFAPHFSYNTTPPTLAWSQQFLLNIGVALSAFGYLTYLFQRESQLGLSRFDIDLFFIIRLSQSSRLYRTARLKRWGAAIYWVFKWYFKCSCSHRLELL